MNSPEAERPLRLALVQANPTVGDIEGNLRLAREWIVRAREAGADLVVFPEMFLSGYPPEDLLLKPSFLRDIGEAVRELARAAEDLTVIVGAVEWEEDLYNAAAVIRGGEVVATYRKVFLPNYGVFDENRYFRPGREALLLKLGPWKVGITICEDLWYPEGPARALGLAGAHLLLNINASPYHLRKGKFRETMAATRAQDNVYTVAYVNLVGGQDELVFDGQSFIVSPAGEVWRRGRAFAEELLLWDLEWGVAGRRFLHDPRKRKAPGEDFPVREVELPPPLPREREPLLLPPETPPLSLEEEVYSALLLGLKDYVHKNGFQKALLGLSGGIDSSLVACLAADALGPENVTAVWLPSRYSSPESREDAFLLAGNLGLQLLTLPIDGLFQAYLDLLRPVFAGRPEDVTEENIQARIRGNLLMALSNKFGWLLLTTGNKSELSVGYATLYGDMAGGFAVLKDVPKLLVYRLARYRQKISPVIPERVFVKAPSAELRPDQKDTDTLPPYEVLDPILRGLIEEDRSPEEVSAQGFPLELVREVNRMVDRAEYKRRQAPPGIKITPRAFGKDRRMPITNRYLR